MRHLELCATVRIIFDCLIFYIADERWYSTGNIDDDNAHQNYYQAVHDGGLTKFTDKFENGTLTIGDEAFDIDGKPIWQNNLKFIDSENEESWKAIPRAWENGY